MAVRFDNMQMLFDKINNGSPFGVIREVFSFSPQLRDKCHFIGFVEIVKNYLLVLAKHTYNKKICYCENK